MFSFADTESTFERSVIAGAIIGVNLSLFLVIGNHFSDYINSKDFFTYVSIVAVLLTVAYLLLVGSVLVAEDLRRRKGFAGLCEDLALFSLLGLILADFALRSEPVWTTNDCAIAVAVSLIILLRRRITSQIVSGIKAQFKNVLDLHVTAAKQLIANPEFRSLGESDFGQLKYECRALQDVRRGEFFACEAGDIAPADCCVVWGQARIVPRALAGFDVPKDCVAGDQICAGSRVKAGKIIVQIEEEFADSRTTAFLPALASALENGDQDIPRREWVVWAWIFFTAFVGVALFKAGYDFRAILRFEAGLLLMPPLFSVVELSTLPWKGLLLGAFERGLFLKSLGALFTLQGLKGILFDGAYVFSQEDPKVTGVIVYDERIERRALFEALQLLASRFDSTLFSALREFVSKEVADGEPQLEFVSIETDPEGEGITAHFDSAELKIGTENYLVSKGVLLDVNRAIGARPESTLYIALDSYPVAEVQFQRCAERLLKEGLQKLRDLDFGLRWYTEQENSAVPASELGLEAAHVIRSHAELKRVEESFTPHLRFSSDERDSLFHLAPALKAGRFNEVKFDVQEFDLTLFQPFSRSAFTWLVGQIQFLARSIKWALAGICLLFPFLVLLLLFGKVGTLEIAAMVSVFSLAVYVFALAYLKNLLSPAPSSD